MHTVNLMDTISLLCIGSSRAVNSVEASQGTENKIWMSNCHPAPSLPPSQDFVVGLSILLRGTVQEKLKWAFNLYDINKDGYITKEVWLVCCCPGFPALPFCPETRQETATKGFSLSWSPRYGKWGLCVPHTL